MRNVSLQRIVLENFRSFRTRTEIVLSPSEGLKFLSGDNLAEPRLGANGAGKSTLWDAVSYCLYGTSVKGLKASDLASWGQSSPYVETEWWIDEESVTIARRGSPNKLALLVEGSAPEPIEQIDVDRIIGLSRLRFLQSVIFGQAVPLFIDLPGPSRGALLDEVLDLGLWLKAADLASKRHTELSRAVDKLNQEIAHATGKLEGLESLESLQALIDTWQDKQNHQVEQMIAAVEAEEAKLAPLSQKIVAAFAAVSALPSSRELHHQIELQQGAKADREARYKTMFAELQSGQKQLAFYQKHKNCPECMQTITAAYARERIDRMSKLCADVQLQIKGNGAQTNGITETLERLRGEQEKLDRKRMFLSEQHTLAAAAFREQERVIDAAVRLVEHLIEATNPHADRYAAVEAERDRVGAQLGAARTQRRQTNATMMRMDFWKAAFKRVRLFMVKRVLAQLEVETSASAAALGLIGWKISFATELETKSGSLQQGIHVRVDSPEASAPWEAWSGGEGQRIRLAVALGLSSLIQRQAGIAISFEVWDEPSAWLSPEGIEDLLDCLQHRVELTHKSIWLCDHRGLQHSSFAEIWRVQKTDKGSTVAMISKAE